VTSTEKKIAMSMMRRIEPVFVTEVIPCLAILPGPAGGRDCENLFEEQPFWVLRI